MMINDAMIGTNQVDMPPLLQTDRIIGSWITAVSLLAQAYQGDHHKLFDSRRRKYEILIALIIDMFNYRRMQDSAQSK